MVYVQAMAYRNRGIPPGPKPKYTVRLHVMLEPELVQRLDAYGDENGQQRSEVVRGFLAAMLTMWESQRDAVASE